MILADKIIKLRKQLGWSQEELAEQMNISRQSVSKWESANSIPDINRIIMLANIFEVSTDFLLKDDIETLDSLSDSKEPSTIQISLEQALEYVENKEKISSLTTKGVVLCLCSVIPLFFFLAMAATNKFNITSDVAAWLGVLGILVMISIGINFFIRTNQYKNDIDSIEKDTFELAYGVHSVIKDKLQKFRSTYNLKLSISIFMFIFSFVPLMFVSMFYNSSDMILLMIGVLFLMIAIGIYIMIPAASKYDTYNNILKECSKKIERNKRTKRLNKLAAFYWPLLAAIYLGWSFWTMDWGVTWIVWPVAAVLFAALVGLRQLIDKEES